jgi:hypothetical protein|tara:strand:- start:95 stop:235 length:141 start_codon:yes stop_codon:yes gene_type:complete
MFDFIGFCAVGYVLHAFLPGYKLVFMKANKNFDMQLMMSAILVLNI